MMIVKIRYDNNYENYKDGKNVWNIPIDQEIPKKNDLIKVIRFKIN